MAAPIETEVVGKKTLRQLLDETEAAYKDCWATLVVIKSNSKRSRSALRRGLLDFQPTLAAALFRLDDFYRGSKWRC
jgi:hypothetical protein